MFTAAKLQRAGYRVFRLPEEHRDWTGPLDDVLEVVIAAAPRIGNFRG
jgi:hypothetical protein